MLGPRIVNIEGNIKERISLTVGTLSLGFSSAEKRRIRTSDDAS